LEQEEDDQSPESRADDKKDSTKIALIESIFHLAIGLRGWSGSRESDHVFGSWGQGWFASSSRECSVGRRLLRSRESYFAGRIRSDAEFGAMNWSFLGLGKRTGVRGAILKRSVDG